MKGLVIWIRGVKDKERGEEVGRQLYGLKERLAEEGILMEVNRVPLGEDRLKDWLFVVDHAAAAEELKKKGFCVLVFLHEENREQDFSGFRYGLEGFEETDGEYFERVYKRGKGEPWEILTTPRCRLRETVPEDVDWFYEIYAEPSVTAYMEDLYEDPEEEKRYVLNYIEKMYGFYGYGMWTVLEKESGRIIGRAGLSHREGFEEPELGFVIGVPWQGQGIAGEVCEAILKYGEERLQFTAIQALVKKENKASIAVCKRLGFEFVEEVEEQGELFSRYLYGKNNN